MQEANIIEQQQGQDQDEPEVRIMPGHIVMMDADLDETQQFYEENLDFHTNEEVIYDGHQRLAFWRGYVERKSNRNL